MDCGPFKKAMTSLIDSPQIPLVPRMNGGYQTMKNSYDGGETGSSRGTPLQEKSSPSRWKNKKMDHVGYRLAKRKEYMIRRRRVSDASFLLGMVGIVLMILETEFNIAHYYDKSSASSFILKLIITISTLLLLGFIVFYHYVDIKLYMVNNGIEDWFLTLNFKRCSKIIVELIICGIHPLPGNFEFNWTTVDPDTKEAETEMVPIDVLFALPMFLRFYLLARVTLLHSRLYTDASSQSLGALQRIHFNFSFIFKSMMSNHPIRVLGCMVTGFFIMFSWAMRACEMYHDEIHRNFFNSMWLISITFLTVGYGDIVPHSYCGRGISVMTGIFGAGCTALVVAVLARKLELSRAEKYVDNFVTDVELDKTHKHAAANILREGWLVFKLKKYGGDKAKLRRHQRRLLNAITTIREVKQAQRRIMDGGITLCEMARQQQTVFDTILDMNEKQKEMENKNDTLQEKLNTIDKKLDHLYKVLTTKIQPSPVSHEERT